MTDAIVFDIKTFEGKYGALKGAKRQRERVLTRTPAWHMLITNDFVSWRFAISVNGDAAKHDELVAEVFASRVTLYDGQGVAEDIGRIVCLGLFAGMRPRNARVKLAPYHRVAPSRHGLVPLQR